MFFLSENKKVKKYAASILIGLFAFVIFFGSVTSALATWWSTEPTQITNTGNNFKTSVESTLQTISQKALEIKEYILDGFAWTAANVLIDTFTDSLVDWINSGFEGSPMFLEHPEDFFGEFGNQLSGALIHEFNLYWLCDPWGDLNFDLDIFLPGTSKSKYECTFEDVIEAFKDLPDINIDIDIYKENIVRKYGSDFRFGGWPMWLHTSNPKNNKAGAIGTAYNDATKKAQEGQREERFGAQLGRGFLGIRQCVEYAPEYDYSEVGDWNSRNVGGYGSGASAGACIKYKTTTPGAIVQEKLDKTLGNDENRLLVADEIDEIIGALATQFVSWIVTGGSDGEGLGAYTGSDSRAGDRDHYGALDDSQDANDVKLKLSEKISNMSKWENKYKNGIDSMKETFEERVEKLTEIWNKLSCIYYGKENKGSVLNDNENCATLLEEGSSSITDLNDIESFGDVSFSDVEKDTISGEITDIKGKIDNTEEKLSYFEVGGKYFDSNRSQSFIEVSEWALEILDNFNDEILGANSKKKINEIKKNYCFNNENYNSNQEKGEICGEVSGEEEFAVKIWAEETAVENGEDTRIYWYATGAEYCEKEEGSGDNDWDFDFSEDMEGSYRTKDFGIEDEYGEYEDEEREYSITCYSEGEEYSTASVTVSSYANAGSGLSADIAASVEEVAFGKSAELRWSGSNVYGSCYLYTEEKANLEGIKGDISRLDEDDAGEWMYSGEGYYLEVSTNNYRGEETIDFEGETDDASYNVSYQFICQNQNEEKVSDNVTISVGSLAKENYTTKGEKKARDMSTDSSKEESKTKNQIDKYTCVLNKYTKNEDVDEDDCKDLLVEE